MDRVNTNKVKEGFSVKSKLILLLPLIILIGVGIWLGTNLLRAESNSAFQDIRPPAVANAFYPGNPDKLQEIVDGFLQRTQKVDIRGEIIGLVVPHAGYTYSGQTAAWGYRQVSGETYEFIVVIAPSHRDPFFGATIYPGDGYKTPLGVVKIEKKIAKKLVDACDVIKFSELGHRGEHAVEVELPFIQTLFPDTPFIPMVVGGYDWRTCEKIGKAVARVLKDHKALIIASSDLYHGYSYSDCKKTDDKTLAAIAALNPEKLCNGLMNEKYFACGGGPITVMEVAAKAIGANKAKLVARTNSGDVTGKKDGYIVGYGAVAVYRESNPTSQKIEFKPLDLPVQKELLRMARQAIKQYLETGKIPKFKPTYDVMKEKRGVFVTITENGRLRGCIGYHENDRPLYELVPDRAVQAAFHDPRFLPLQKDEFDKIKIKISVYLTNVYPIKSIDEFKMGKQGIIMMKDGRGATYLPEVPLEAGWKTKEEELESLCHKAGLPGDAWRHGAKFWVYETQVFDESIL